MRRSTMSNAATLMQSSTAVMLSLCALARLKYAYTTDIEMTLMRKSLQFRSMCSMIAGAQPRCIGGGTVGTSAAAGS